MVLLPFLPKSMYSDSVINTSCSSLLPPVPSIHTEVISSGNKNKDKTKESGCSGHLFLEIIPLQAFRESLYNG